MQNLTRSLCSKAANGDIRMTEENFQLTKRKSYLLFNSNFEKSWEKNVRMPFSDDSKQQTTTDDNSEEKSKGNAIDFSRRFASITPKETHFLSILNSLAHCNTS